MFASEKSTSTATSGNPDGANGPTRSPIHAASPTGRETTPAVESSLRRPVISTMRIAISILVLMLAGCASKQPAAENVAVQAQLSLLNYQRNMTAIFEAMLADYRTKAIAEADALANAAIKAETDKDGKANVANITLIEQKRLDHYKQIELVCVGLRAKFIAASKDAENAAQYMTGLKDYFAHTTSTAETFQTSSTAAIALIDQYLASRKAGGK